MNQTLQEIYPYFIKFHVVFSIVFLSMAVGISVYALINWLKKKSYNQFDNQFRKAFLIMLYIDCILGFILYFFLQKPADVMTAAEAMKLSSLRFWAIQHFSNMVFIVILCQLGSMFIHRTANPVKKFKYSFIYFGVSTLIIIISVSLFALKK